MLPSIAAGLLSSLCSMLAGGAVTLNNVELRTEVLQQELDTPLTFKRIFIQELKLNIPWASLRYQPAKVCASAGVPLCTAC
jgi:hypothetical protein